MTNEFRIKNGLIVGELNYPAIDGTSGQVITTDGAGNLTFGAVESGLSGVAASGLMTDLTDVNITKSSAIDGQVVYWDDTAGMFQTKALSGAQNLWSTFSDGSNSAVAATDSDTFTFTSGTGISLVVDGTGKSLTITNDSPNVDQNVWTTITSDSGNATPSTTTSNLSILGGTNISTEISGDSLTINYTGPNQQNNFNATTDPTVSNDINEGYDVGSVWINTSTNEAYRLVDSSSGAAVWTNTTLTTDELAIVATSGNYADLTNKPFVWSTISADTGSTSADVELDTLTISGGANVTTEITGDTLTISFDNGSGLYLTEVVEDTTPQLGGDLDVQTHALTTSTSNGNITLTPNGTGKVILSGLSYPSADGTNGQVLTTDGAGTLTFETIDTGPTTLADLTDTTIGTLATDNLLSWNGSAWVNVAPTFISEVIEDTTPQLSGDLDVNGNSIVSASGSNGNVTIAPDGTGRTEIGGISYSNKTQSAIAATTTDGSVTTFDTTIAKAIFVDYLLETTNGVRTGTLHIVHNGATVNVADSGSEINDVGVLFGGSIIGSTLTLQYTSTGAGNSGTIKFQSRYWI